MAHWSIDDMPPQAGRLAVITGATGGLGFETALALAAAGANVVLTGRNLQKGNAALAAIRAQHPAAVIRYEHLDLASLASVREFAERLAHAHAALDLLVNNAGVMTPPARKTTADGFELQFGTNYLGHFALTGQLLPLLRNGRRPRVVNLSSLAHKLRAAIHFDDLQWARRYDPWPAYAQSKLAMLMFALELQRRSDAYGWGLMSNAAHPGFARTDLIANGPGEHSAMQRFGRWTVQPMMSQSAADGALPTLLAATAPEALPGGYYGPMGWFELKGAAGVAAIAPRAQDKAVAARLWEVSEALTNLRWPRAKLEHVS
ncbi:MAG TPA: oxidoreductase [Paraburkholderia sp.]|jgi:NAD(P)-dependent dehydrogenase (short-subunit alcohol dehydrogenase family)|nr:oxidoreductase [Paraburkholderia sp.]